ncbi:MAG: LysM peptidoglycan-binding domain-containing protein [Chloroflexi bacterium]|nr:LysM peptidoglycan-binding domain-containing protein [Chloroflexota bacterium]
MMRRLQLSLLCLILLVGAGNTSPAAAQSDTAYQVIQLVNGFRAGYSLPPFQINSALMSAAQNQANYMATNTIFTSHVGAGGSTPQSRANAAGYVGYVSENIVGGTGMTPNQGFIWWENSPVHYNTLVTTRYIEAGTGYATNGSENFYVLVVGRPSDAPPVNVSDNDSPAPLFITPIELAKPNEDGSIIHVVQEGQALWTLAAYYETDMADLMLFNNLSENAILRPGDAVMIRLAEGQEPPPTPTPPLTHIVREGENAWTIAAAHGLPLSDFLWLNGLDENAFLQPGEEVTVRLAPGQAPPPTPTPITTHIVRSGQTLWDIALTYGLTLEDLLAYNEMSADAILQIGQELRVRPPAPPMPTAAPPTAVSLSPTPKSPPTVTPVVGAAATAVPPTPAPISPPTPPLTTDSPNQSVTTGAAVLAIGLTVLAGAFIVIGRRSWG